HWNPTTHPHGQWDHEDGHYLGDLGNIEVGEDGTGSITITTDRWELGTGGMADIVGTAVIVHTSADDFTTQPTGNAGGREACGVVPVAGGSRARCRRPSPGGRRGTRGRARVQW